MGLGADDYIQKAASREVLLARIRRALDRRAAGGSRTKKRILVGQAEVDVTTRTAFLKDGGQEKLTGSEIDCLTVLDSDRTKYFKPEEICPRSLSDATVRSHISRLKAKLGASGELIRSERNLGYRLLPQP